MQDLGTLSGDVASNSNSISINDAGEITGLGLTSTGEIHPYLAIPTHGDADSESASQGVISRKILSDDARKLLQQQLRFTRPGARGIRATVCRDRGTLSGSGLVAGEMTCRMPGPSGPGCPDVPIRLDWTEAAKFRRLSPCQRRVYLLWIDRLQQHCRRASGAVSIARVDGRYVVGSST